MTSIMSLHGVSSWTPVLAGTVMLLALATVARAQDITITPENVAHNERDYSPYVDQQCG